MTTSRGSRDVRERLSQIAFDDPRAQMILSVGHLRVGLGHRQEIRDLLTRFQQVPNMTIQVNAQYGDWFSPDIYYGMRIEGPALAVHQLNEALNAALRRGAISNY